VSSIQHCLFFLRQLLSPRYAVIPITEEIIKSQPWTVSCALICFPGGDDLKYCESLNGPGNFRIQEYVEKGGSYLGFGAGGYYGSNRYMRIVKPPEHSLDESRELSFFPGACRGPAIPRYVYHNELDAKVVRLIASKDSFSKQDIPVFNCYYNDGGVFVDAALLKDQGVEILAKYFDHEVIDDAAVVSCKIGKGSAVLTAPHLELVILAEYLSSF
jgi:biotin--protein ligase